MSAFVYGRFRIPSVQRVTAYTWMHGDIALGVGVEVDGQMGV